jgi:phage/plasmid primase-like uncharacterized protein
MKTPSARLRAYIQWLALPLSLFLTSACQGQILWSGAGDGTTWSNPQNWVGQQVPGPADNVVITNGAGTNVVISSAVSVESIQCSLALTIASGSLTVTTGASSLQGFLTVSNGAALSASGNGTTLTSLSSVSADGANFNASVGAVLSLPGVVNYQAGCENPTWAAIGAGSVLELPGLISLQGANCGLFNALNISALNGGQVLLSNVVTIVSDPVSVQSQGTNSVVDLSDLTTNGGLLYVNASDGGRVLAPQLANAGSINLTVAAGGFISSAQFTNIDGASLNASGGAVLSLPSVVGFQAGCANPVWQANGPGSVLELPGLTSLQGANCGLFNALNIEALSGGQVLLSNVVTIVSDPVLVLSEGTNSVVDLSGLTSNGGSLNVDASGGGSVLAPQLVNSGLMSLTLGAGGFISTAQFTNINGANLSVSGGAVLSLPAVVGFQAGCANPIWQANGAGSVLELPGLTSLQGANCGLFNALNLEALSGGQVLLTNVVTIVSDPVSVLSEGTNSVVDLSGLTSNGGSLNVDASGGGSVLVPQLANSGLVSLTLTASGFISTAQFTNIDGANLLVSGGAVLSLPSVLGYQAGCASPIWQANGADSVLELPGLTSLQGANCGLFNALNIEALNGGQVLLSNVATIVSDPVSVESQGTNSVVDLAKLVNYPPATTTLSTTNGGVILLPSLLTKPTITWSNPAPISYGTALSSIQLDATANVLGGFAYNPTNGTVLNAGADALTVIFTPTNTADYSSATDTVSLAVSPAPLTVTAANASREFGAPNPGFTGTITGLANGDNITATYSTTATVASPVGTYPIVPSLVDPDNRLTNYTTNLVNGTLTVTPTNGVITWINSDGGDWNSADNWSPNEVPVPSNTVYINLNGSYTVTLDVAAKVESLTSDAGNGSQVFSIPSNTLTLTTNSSLGANCQLSLGTGAISVLGGTLSLLDGVVSSNGTLDVAAGATVDLTGGNTVNWAGQLNGTGPGQVLFTSGTIRPSPTLTLAFSSNLFQWGNGLFAGGSVTNAGAMTINGNAATLNGSITFVNQDVVKIAGANGMAMDANGVSYNFFDNLAGATFQFAGDGNIFADGCCGEQQIFNNQGLVWKSAGSNTASISVTFNDQDGALQVDSGTLSLSGGGTRSNTTFIVAAGATLDPLDGSTVAWSGQLTGSGQGQVVFNNGVINPNSTLTLAFTNDLFQWGNGAFIGGTVINNGILPIEGHAATLSGNIKFINQNLVQVTGGNGMAMDANGVSYNFFDNLAGATFQFTGGGSVFPDGCCGEQQTFNNQGLVWKSGGVNAASISVIFNDEDGVLQVDSGTLSLSGGGTRSNTTFIVAAGATLDPLAGSTVAWSGRLTGSGQGQVVFNSGVINPNPTLTLAFTNDLFQWGDGLFIGGTVTNAGLVTIDGTAATLNGGITFINQDLVQVIGGNGMAMDANGVSYNLFDNLAEATFQLTGDGSVFPDGCCGEQQTFNNQGLVWKSGGSNSSTISVVFNNQDGALQVDSGTLSLSGGGTRSNTTFIVAAGATLDPLAGSTVAWSGRLTGSGQGLVVFNNGFINPNPSLTLAFTNNLLQWGDALFIGGTVTNAGLVTIDGTAATLNGGITFVNQDVVQVIGDNGLAMDENGVSYNFFDNLAGATFQFTGDGSVFPDGCCGEQQTFINQGLVWKSGGSNTSTISVYLENQGGTIQVDSGTLALSGGGSSSNGAFLVAAGATVNLTGGSTVYWSGRLTGGGGGQVLFNSGLLYPNPTLTLDCTNGTFQWGNGLINTGTVTNTGVVTINGSTATLNGSITFVNRGLVQVVGNNGLAMDENGVSYNIFDNLAGATFQFAGDGTIYPDGCCGEQQTFNNQGLVWKSSGSNTSTISVTFSNQAGALRVDSGTLSLGGNSYAQGGGNLTIGIAGPGAGQNGSLALTGAASLNGPLNLVLAQGYVPPVGSQFQILSAGSLSGTFSSLSLPSGFLINYSNTSVYVTYTGAATYVISASNNPPSAGSVANTGVFIVGTTNLLVATPSYGYAFGNWTEGNRIVGTNAILTNVVTADGNFVANYAATNLTHFVTVTTSPEGVAPVSGAGTYNDGQPVTIRAPIVATNGQEFYTFQYFTLNGLFASSNNIIETVFSTLNQSNIAFVADYSAKPLLPQVVDVTANYNINNVSATTNFVLQLQFDRTMNTANAPKLIFTNAAPGAVQPKAGPNGRWSTTVFASDTYATPPITFGPGMDGTVQVLASGAADTNGNKLASTNVLTLTVLSTPPTVTLSSPTNGASFTTTNTITLSASASSIYAITNLAIYSGTNALGTTTASNLTLATNGLAAGSHPLFAVAMDANGTSATSLVAHVTVNIPGTTLIDFEALNATAGPVTNGLLNQYLAGYGVTIRGVTTNTTVAVQNDQNILDGTVTVASSGVNLLTQIGTNGEVSYTLAFNQPYQSVHWTRTELLPGIWPEWSARAYDTNGVELGSVGENQRTGNMTNPAAPFTLSGSNIASVTFSANNDLSPLNSLPLDDLLLSTFPPGANINITLSAEGGTNFSAPGQITLIAAASETGGVISQIAFYEGQNLLGTATATTNAALGLTNVAAGTYAFTAVASDGTNVRSSTPLYVNVAASTGLNVINFDALDATAGAVGGAPLSNYLAGFGVSLADVTLGTRLEVVNENNLSGSAAAVPSSPPNLFTQAGLNTAVKFSFVFAAPLRSFGFTRVELAAGPSGVTRPAWTAFALDVSGNVLETASETLNFSSNNVPARLFQLTGNGIARVRFESDSQGAASFSAVLLDDLVLDTNAVANGLSVTLQAPGGPFTAGVPIALTAAVTDTLGGAPSVAFYDGGNLIGTNQGSSGSIGIVWSNVLAGAHSLTAQLSDSTGYAVSSPTVLVTVKAATSGFVPVLVNFDSLNAAPAPVTGAPLAAYLSAAGMTVTNISAGTKLAVENQSFLNGGGFVVASSPSNVLTQIGSNNTVSFTLSFSPLLTQFAFTRPELEANPFVTEPAWEVQAYDALGVPLAQTSEGLISSYTNVPAQLFALQGAAIATVQFISLGSGQTTFDSLVMDDFILTTSSNLQPSVVLTNPLPGQTFTAPALIAFGAEAVAAHGTVANVSFYAGTNQVGAAATSPFLFYWTNPPPGSYTLTAVAADSSGLTRTSPPVNITVNPAPTEFGILTQPVGATVAAGGSATFTVATTGTNAVTYQWYQNGGSLSGQTQSQLSLYPVSDGSDGTYTVIATSGTQALLSQGAVLIVLDPPVIGSQPQSQQAQIGSNVTLTVGATGSAPLNYQWLLNGTGIDGATNASLVIPVAQPLNSGNYQVIVGNQVGFAESTTAVVSVSVAGSLDESTNLFSNRISIDPLVGPVFGDTTNANAALEAGAPQFIAGKPYGRSIWYTWHASFDGVISLTTRGSSFDTLLAVYTGTNVADLTSAAEDDDSGGFFTSLVTFNCVAGTDYAIDVAGFRGASGQVVLGLPAGTSYRVLNSVSGDAIPFITQPPTNQNVPAEATVKLSVVAASPTPLTYQWFFQSAPIAGASSHTLTLTNFQSGAVGSYYALVANAIGSIPSAKANLQIAAQNHGTTNSGYDKFGDAVDLSRAGNASGGHGGATPAALPLDGGGDTAGYSVAQTFSTVGDTKEPGEPEACGQTGGASEWYIYTTPAAGTFHVDTTGSDFNTLVGVFTNAGTVLAFSNLVEQGCGYTTNYVADGQPSINLFDVPAGTEFFIVVDGYHGASGMVQMHLGLGAPPALLTQPQSRPAAPGGSAAFSVVAVGTTNLFYQWQFDGAGIPGASHSSFTVSNAQASSAGNYSVIVSNVVDVVTSAPAVLTLQSTPFIFGQPAGQAVNVGQSAGFSVSAGGVAPLSYQWYVNGEPVAHASGSSLAVPATKFASAGSYTVVITNLLGSVTSVPAYLTVSEIIKPTLSVTYPSGNITTNNASITLRGTASDALDVTSVQLLVNGTLLQTAAGTSNWSSTVALQVGANSVTVHSYNVSHLVSIPVTRTITYIVISPLTLQTTGSGKITGETNQAPLQIGKSYTVTATPATSFLFSNWTGSNLAVLGTNHVLSFVMATNLLLQANFVTNPFPAVAGTYHGLFSPTNGVTEQSSGFITLTFDGNLGSYTADIQLAGGTHGFTGGFDLTGRSQASFTGPDQELVTVVLQVNLNLDPPDNQITGLVSGSGWQSGLMADRAVFNGTSVKATNYAARYTLIIPPVAGAPQSSPGGYGVATITNNLAGMANLIGTLGDGTAINQIVPISQNGVIPVYVSRYTGEELLLGWITFTNVPPQTLSGVLNWIKASGATKPFYPGGFSNQTAVVGSVYEPGGLSLTNGTLTIAGAAQATNLVYTNVTVAGGKLSYSGADNPTNQLSAAFTAGTGAMTLTFRPTGARANLTAQGVVLQMSGTNAAGWFKGTNESGSFLLQP